MTSTLQVLALDNLKRQSDRLKQASSWLGRGSLVAIPTELGYVLAARADLPEALQRLRGDRDVSPLWLMVPELDSAAASVKEIPADARTLAATFWPGPLVFLLARAQSAPSELGGPTTKVGVWAPYHGLAQAMARYCNFPLAVAPLRLRIRPEEALVPQVARGLEGQAEGMLEWREPPLGLEPTVLDLVVKPLRVVRLGFVTVEELELTLGRRPMLSSDTATPERFVRYAPEARVILVEGDVERVARRLKFLRDTFVMTERLALIVSQQMADGYLTGMDGLRVAGSREDAEGFGRGLRAIMADIEAHQSASTVLVEGIPREGAGVEIMEQLARTAHQVINTEDPGFAGQAGMQPRRKPK